jgi:hypothetical protein
MQKLLGCKYLSSPIAHNIKPQESISPVPIVTIYSNYSINWLNNIKVLTLPP